MKIILTLTVLVSLIGCAASTTTKEDLGYQGQNSDGLGVSELLARFKSDPNVQVRVEGDWHNVEVKSERALYSFTPNSHPAHPSYVKREVLKKDGAIYIETSARCGAEKSICDQLVRDFIELNDKVKNGIGG